MCVLAQALLAAFRAWLGPGYATATASASNGASSTPPEPSPATGDTLAVTRNRRAHSSVLRQSDLHADTAILWWQNRRLRFQLS